MAQLGGGFGNKGFGAGSLTVVRAMASDGQTARVVFNQRPLARSPIGNGDALNVANYRFSILAPGVGTAPTPVGVAPALVEGPAFGPVLAGQWAADVRVDSPLIAGLTYLVTVSGLVATSGDILGLPVAAPFVGVVMLQHTAAPVRDLSNVDLATDPFTGAFVYTNAGDIGTDGGLAGLRKRIFRRLGTPKNAFRFLPGYGAALPLKAPFSVSALGTYKTDLLQQIKREPEVADASVSATIKSYGNGSIVTVTVRARTKTGLVLNLQAQQSGDGRFAVTS